MTRLIYAFIVCTFSLFSATSHAQTAQPEKPYINVTGVAEQSVIPDEIYIRISITE